MRPWGFVALIALIGCSFDATGSGDDGGDDGGDGSDGSGTDGTGADGGGGDGGGADDGGADDGGTGGGGDGGGADDGGTSGGDDGGWSGNPTGDGGWSGNTSTSGDGGGTGGGFDQPCGQMFVKEVVLAEDATLQPPMELEMSSMGEGMVALSRVEEQGTATFSVEIPCVDEFHLWGRINDAHPGVNQNDPDSLHISVDGGPEDTWFYGCQTDGDNDQWTWKDMRAGIFGQPCEEATAIVADLDTGTHEITVRNREAEGPDGEVAAISRILVTNDPGYKPGPGD